MATTPTPTPEADVPAGVAETLAAAIRATGFRWAGVDFKVADLDGYIQHRHAERIHNPTVRRYRNMFDAGSQCPPIGVTRDGMTIWGNQRGEAAKLAGVETIPAIVFDVDGADANTDDFLRNSLISLAVAENAPHGLPYNPADRQHAARSLIELGFTNKSISKELGLSDSQVSGIRAEAEAEKRFAALSLADVGVSRSVLRVLAGPDVRVLNDEPFKDLVDLAEKASLTGGEIREVARAARATGSEKGMTKVIADARTDFGQRISELAAGGRERPTPRGRLHDALKRIQALCELPGAPGIFRDRTDGVDDTVTALNASLGCLNSIIALQETDES